MRSKQILYASLVFLFMEEQQLGLLVNIAAIICVNWLIIAKKYPCTNANYTVSNWETVLPWWNTLIIWLFWSKSSEMSFHVAVRLDLHLAINSHGAAKRQVRQEMAWVMLWVNSCNPPSFKLSHILIASFNSSPLHPGGFVLLLCFFFIFPCSSLRLARH